MIPLPTRSHKVKKNTRPYDMSLYLYRIYAWIKFLDLSITGATTVDIMCVIYSEDFFMTILPTSRAV